MPKLRRLRDPFKLNDLTRRSTERGMLTLICEESRA